MSLFWEKRYPTIISLAVCFIWISFSVDILSVWPIEITVKRSLFPLDKTPILSASLTLGAILSGFLATSQAILMGINGNIKNDLVSSGYITDLASYLSEGILSSLLFALVSLMSFFFCLYWMQIIWLFCAFSSVLAFWRVTSITLKILQIN